MAYALYVLDGIAAIYAPFVIPLLAMLLVCGWMTRKGLMRKEEE